MTGGNVVSVTAKKKLHELVDRMSDSEAEAMLERAERGPTDPMTEVLDDAPLDDEPLTPEEEQGVREAKAEIARGEAVPLEEARRELT
jgi:hypothetical protein